VGGCGIMQKAWEGTKEERGAMGRCHWREGRGPGVTVPFLRRISLGEGVAASFRIHVLGHHCRRRHQKWINMKIFKIS